MKLCQGPCAQVKEDAKFYVKRYKNGLVGLRSYCIECGTKERNDWRERNREHDNARNNAYNKANARKIRGHKLTKYWPGTTPEQALEKFERLNAAQNYRCAICRKPATGPKGLAVDHCHKTNTVRGLLCNKCNRGIGLLDECPEVIKSAIDYLKKSA